MSTNELGALGTAFVDIRGRTTNLRSDVDAAQGVAMAGLAKMGSALSNVGRSLSAAVTLPLVGLGAAVFKVGTDFETAFAGVRKTVDGTEAQFAKLRDGFREMSKEVPTTASELAKIGEIAGQMNVPVDDIQEFTRVIAMMGTATNLSTEQAATAFGQLGNVMKTPIADFERLGSTIVALGNKSNATESQIVDMAQRIASTGAQVGLSEAQLLSWATALADAGIDAEAGGTAIAKVFKQIAVDVATGGGNLLEFAAVAKMSVGEFSALFEKDASAATEAFVRGLGQIKEEGGSAIVTLENMGLTEVRLSNALLSLSSNHQNLTRFIKEGTAAWNENTALSKEATEFYKTTVNQLKILANSLADAGIQLFDALGPIIKDTIIPGMRSLIESVTGLAKSFSALDPSTQAAIVSLAAAAAVAGPLLVVMGSLASSIVSIKTAWALMTGPATAANLVMSTVGTTTGTTTTAMTGLAGAITGATVGALVVLAGQLWELQKAVTATHQAQANLKVHMSEAAASTERAAAALKDKYGIAIAQGTMSTAQWSEAIGVAAQAAGWFEGKTRALTAAVEADNATRTGGTARLAAAFAASQKQMAEATKEAGIAFTATLRPADELEKQLGMLSTQFSKTEILSVYQDEIIRVVEAQHKNKKAVSDLMGEMFKLALQLKDSESATTTNADAFDKMGTAAAKAATDVKTAAEKIDAANRELVDNWNKRVGPAYIPLAELLPAGYKTDRERTDELAAATMGAPSGLAAQSAIPAGFNLGGGGGTSTSVGSILGASGQPMTPREMEAWWAGLGPTPGQISAGSIGAIGSRLAPSVAGLGAERGSSGTSSAPVLQPMVNVTIQGSNLTKQEVYDVVLPALDDAIETGARGYLERWVGKFERTKGGITGGVSG